MASLIMAAEPLVVPVAATVVLQPIDTGSCACGLLHELTCDAWEALMPQKCPSNGRAVAERVEALRGPRCTLHMNSYLQGLVDSFLCGYGRRFCPSQSYSNAVPSSSPLAETWELFTVVAAETAEDSRLQ